MLKLMRLKEQANLWAPHPSGEFNLATSNTTIATNTPALMVGEHKTSYTFYCDVITPFGRGWIRYDFLTPLEGE